MIEKKPKRNGYTLVEVLVSVAILFIVLTIVYDFFINITNVARKQDKSVNIELQAKRLQNDIKQWFQMSDQNLIECYPLSKRVGMYVYEYDMDSKSFLQYYIEIQYNNVQQAITINKYETSNGYVNKNKRVQSTSYLANKVKYFTVEKKGNLISIEYIVEVKDNKNKKYEVVHYCRTN